MVAEFKVTGAEQLRALGRDLKMAGEEGKGLRRELLAGMRFLSKPLVDATRASAEENLPRRGGLNDFIASSDIKVRNSLTGRRAGMRIVAKKAGGSKGFHDLEAFDNGWFRHPVYGNRRKWIQQGIAPGWFSKPLNEAVPEVAATLSLSMNVIARRITRD